MDCFLADLGQRKGKEKAVQNANNGDDKCVSSFLSERTTSIHSIAITAVTALRSICASHEVEPQSSGKADVPSTLSRIANTKKLEAYFCHPPRSTFEIVSGSAQPLSAMVVSFRILSPMEALRWKNATAALEHSAEVKGIVKTLVRA